MFVWETLYLRQVYFVEHLRFVVIGFYCDFVPVKRWCFVVILFVATLSL